MNEPSGPRNAPAALRNEPRPPRNEPGALRIALVDYGAGNLVSIEQALTAVGAQVTLTRDPGGFSGADALVVPGVGAAAPAMDRLRDQGLVEPIREWISSDRPYLGICLGLQLLLEGSDEDGAETLGLLPGRTVLLEDAPTLPHIGWNQVERRRAHALFDGIADGADFYFVHSYVGRPDPAVWSDLVLSETSHGGTFASALSSGSLVGVQFHPERSGTDGLRLLANFAAFARDRITATLDHEQMPTTVGHERPAATAAVRPRSPGR